MRLITLTVPQYKAASNARHHATMSMNVYLVESRQCFGDFAEPRSPEQTGTALLRVRRRPGEGQ